MKDLFQKLLLNCGVFDMEVNGRTRCSAVPDLVNHGDAVKQMSQRNLSPAGPSNNSIRLLTGSYRLKC